MANKQEMQEYLRSRKWKLLDKKHPWCWQDPKTKAQYTIADAYALQQNLDKNQK